MKHEVSSDLFVFHMLGEEKALRPRVADKRQICSAGQSKGPPFVIERFELSPARVHYIPLHRTALDTYRLDRKLKNQPLCHVAASISQAVIRSRGL